MQSSDTQALTGVDKQRHFIRAMCKSADAESATQDERALLGGRLGYEIAYDVNTPAAADWIYPREIDFLQNRLVVLRRVRHAPNSATCGATVS